MTDRSAEPGRLSVFLKALETQGPGWALTRVRILLLIKSGLIEQRTPLLSWDNLSLATCLRKEVPVEAGEYFAWRQLHSSRFLFENLPSIGDDAIVGAGSVSIADNILAGEFPFFGYSQFLGFPPNWQQNPLTHDIAADGHWTKIHEFASGDIKLWWEASRFTWAFALGRAYARMRDERYAEAFWLLFENWMAQNPPNRGVNWKCGQETSFRAMALCFGFYIFARSPSSTPARVARFLSAMSEHAKRIDAFVEYAKSQNNNHGISEGVGLWTIGILFPELQGATRWRGRGKQLIESETRRQVYSDGSYIQHSMNYHRVMLQDLAWALRLGELNDDRLAPDVYDCFRKAVRFLHGLTDSQSGWAPNYGANDGALVLPLSDCAYPDMRPALQSCHHLVERERLYPAGPWDEEMVWLNGTESLAAKEVTEVRPLIELNSSAGGCFTIHSAESWIMLRGARYKDRPSHADQLHLDLWWRGENVLCDAGTYSYNAEAPFDDSFASTRHHNTVTVDALDQMTRLSRFLWTDWADASVRRVRNPSNGLPVLEGSHDGYARFGVFHRRAVFQATDSLWVVVDDMTGRGEHDLRLHWQTPDIPFQAVSAGSLDLNFIAGNVRIQLASSAQSELDVVRGGERIAGSESQAPDPARGWHSRYYNRREPAISITAECRSLLPVRFVTTIMLGKTYDFELTEDLTGIQVNSNRIALSALGESPILANAI
jgi:hypothetical protein